MKISRLYVFISYPPIYYSCDYDRARGYEIEQVGSVFRVSSTKKNAVVAEISTSLPHVVEYG